eukprot:TRINITY_DN24298_c0_g1_i1.p1 TRINITY_DN24298_c0_g1~~TRINITY_DN24298_c0_g1_i1.p1  ORF type:complete len:176 (+),score=20.95 TRINITY_DN24298_c0_g1_i1:50-577(+)
MDASTLGVPPSALHESQSFQDVLLKVKSGLDFVEQAPTRINMMCFCGGLAIILNGIFGVLNVFAVFDNTIYYVVNLYTVFFGVVTCITESRGDFQPTHDMVEATQKWMHEWAKGLTMLWGRGLFYIFQGTLAVLSSGLISFGIFAGSYMMLMGMACVGLHFRKRGPPPEDYIRIH